MVRTNWINLRIPMNMCPRAEVDSESLAIQATTSRQRHMWTCSQNIAPLATTQDNQCSIIVHKQGHPLSGKGERCKATLGNGWLRQEGVVHVDDANRDE